MWSLWTIEGHSWWSRLSKLKRCCAMGLFVPPLCACWHQVPPAMRYWGCELDHSESVAALVGPKPSELWCASHLHSEGCPGTASTYKRRGVRGLWDRRAVRKAGRRFCTQAILHSSNASPDDLSGAEPQPWCLNSLGGEGYAVLSYSSPASRVANLRTTFL